MAVLRSIALALLLGLAALFPFGSPALAAQDNSTDRPGLDYRTFQLNAPNPAECEARCMAEARCRAWSFAWPGAKGARAVCALKRGVPPKEANTCCISGVKGKAGAQPAPQQQPPAQSGDAVEQAPPPKRVEPTPQTNFNSGQPQPQPLPPEPQAEPESAPATEPPAAAAPPQSKEEACRAYADDAERQNKENIDLKCGFEGGRWGYTNETYFNWCMRNGDAARIANTQAREGMLAKCRGGPAPVPLPPAGATPAPGVAVPPDPATVEGRCRDYADRSTAQIDDNVRLNCGFDGGDWSGTHAQFYEQCLQIGPDEAGVGYAERERALAQCRGASSAPTACEIYADRVLALEAQVRGTPCARILRGWAFDRPSILEWCAGSDQLEREQTLIVKAQEVELCLNRPIGNQRCRDYAQTAMDQIDQMVRFECGFAGPLWIPDYDTHLRFCLASRSAVLEYSQRQREELMISCEAGQFRRLPQELRQ